MPQNKAKTVRNRAHSLDYFPKAFIPVYDEKYEENMSISDLPFHY